MARLWQEHVEKGWEAITLQPGQERSERLTYDPNSETLSVKREVYDPRTGLKHEGKRPKCHVEDSAGGGQLVLDEPLGRPCVFLVRTRAHSDRATKAQEGGEHKDEDDEDDENDEGEAKEQVQPQ